MKSQSPCQVEFVETNKQLTKNDKPQTTNDKPQTINSPLLSLWRGAGGGEAKPQTINYKQKTINAMKKINKLAHYTILLSILFTTQSKSFGQLYITQPPFKDSSTNTLQAWLNTKSAADTNSGVKVTISFTNQQFNNIPKGVVNTGAAMLFGSTSNMLGTEALPAPFFNKINYSNDNAGYAFNIYNNVYPLFANNAPLNQTQYYGNITLQFSKPVNNPMIYLNNLGAFVKFSDTNVQGFTTELQLVSAKKLILLNANQNLTVHNNTIQNNIADTNYYKYNGSGIFLVKGNNITSLTFKVFIKGNGKGSAWASSGINAGDLFSLGIQISDEQISTINKYVSSNPKP